MWRRSLLAWSACLLVGAWLIRPITQHVAFVDRLASHEAVHIVAHLVLYGTATVLARRAGLRPAHAALLAMTIAVLQESAQVIQVGRWPEGSELFDLCVDGVAVMVALALTRVTPPISGTDPVSRR
jgi:hypothetical protein